MEAALLLRAAIPPRSARKGAALRERWTRQLDLTSALGSRLADETSEQAMVDAAVEEVHAALDAIGDGAAPAARRRARWSWSRTAGVLDRPDVRELHDPGRARPGRPLPARGAGRAAPAT